VAITSDDAQAMMRLTHALHVKLDAMVAREDEASLGSCSSTELDVRKARTGPIGATTTTSWSCVAASATSPHPVQEAQRCWLPIDRGYVPGPETPRLARPIDQELIQVSASSTEFLERRTWR
jgi:hypothetical protein